MFKEKEDLIKGLEEELQEEKRKSKVFFQEKINLQDKLARIQGKSSSTDTKSSKEKEPEAKKEEAK